MGSDVRDIDIYLASEIFKSNNWSFDSSNSCGSLFDNYCKLLSTFNSEERELIVILSKQFKKIDLEHYSSMLIGLIPKFNSIIRMRPNEIIIVPTQSYKNPRSNWFLDTLAMFLKKFFHIQILHIQTTDEVSVKSGDLMAYLVKHQFLPRTNLNTISNVYIKTKNTDFPSNKNDGNRVFIVVDDFIGSGTTISNCLKTIQKQVLPSDQIIVLTLVILESGLRKLRKQFKSDIIFSSLLNKGISQSATIKDKDAAIKIMKSIEMNIDTPGDLSLGFKRSQALVSLLRTPNNTFPVFWQKTSKNNIQRTRPFFR